MSSRPAFAEVLRGEAPHVVGALVRRFGRFDAAEDATQEALIAASRQWPEEGMPDEPRSWLIRVAYRRMIDLIRSEQSERHREETYVARDPRLASEGNGPGPSTLDEDDSLQVLLLCCHPVLSSASRIALTLRAVGGLSTAEIARAYGVTEQTLGVRISRAKQQLRRARARFEPDAGEDPASRLAAVMRVLYLIFNEGYTASSGDRLVRVDLADEAIRLTRMLHRQAPTGARAEVGGLLALMLLLHARRDARLDDVGNLVPLGEQDRGRWDRRMLDEGLALIRSIWSDGDVGSYRLQAAIAAVHAEADDAAETDWTQIAGLYVALEHAEPSGPTMLARVVAVAHAYGHTQALDLLARLDAEHGLLRDPLTAQRARAIRAHLLDRDGRGADARAEYLAAADLTANHAEDRYLRRRADDAAL